MSHPLYGTFMSRLSSVIFDWGREDFKHLMSAKKGEMVAVGILNPSPSAVQKAFTKDEMARHCKRRTRGIKRTTEAIEALLSFSLATDTFGVPLLHLGRAAEACHLHPGSNRSGTVYSDWPHPQGWW